MVGLMVIGFGGVGFFVVGANFTHVICFSPFKQKNSNGNGSIA
jgi:hypothetical protein